MSVCTGGEGKGRVGLLGAGLALVRVIIAKWCFGCRSSLLSSHKRRKSCALKFLPSSLFLGTHLPAPFLSHPLMSALLQAIPHQPTPPPSRKQTLQPLYFPTVCNSAADGAGDCWLRFLASSCAGWLAEAWAWLDGHWLTVLLEDWDG